MRKWREALDLQIMEDAGRIMHEKIVIICLSKIPQLMQLVLTKKKECCLYFVEKENQDELYRYLKVKFILTE